MSSSDFLLISDPKIWAVPVKECGEPLIDLKTLGFRMINHHVAMYEGINKNTQVRLSVSRMLTAAQSNLPKGITFLFSEGYRPLTVQKKLFTDYCAMLRKNHPDWSDENIQLEATKYVAPIEDVPPHSTGGAIDITLMTEEGEELDMGCALDETPEENQNASFTHAETIGSIAKKNRQILIDALSKMGFVNYPAEWWHWSYGDKYWAYHAKQPHAIYGSIT